MARWFRELMDGYRMVINQAASINKHYRGHSWGRGYQGMLRVTLVYGELMANSRRMIDRLSAEWLVNPMADWWRVAGTIT